MGMLAFWRFLSKIIYFLSRGPRMVVLFSGIYIVGFIIGAVLAIIR